MNIIICIDERNGMLFNHRRQSRDKAVIEKIYEITKGKNLWIREFSKALFPEKLEETETNLFLDDEMLVKAGVDDYCFVEDMELLPYINNIQKLYLFKWNRIYPQDFSLDLDVEQMFKRIYTEEFTGNSHDKVTLEVWKR